MLSCLYRGNVQHRRHTPVENQFRYGLYMLYLDLDELPALLQGNVGLQVARFSPASFRREDHLGDPATPLSQAVRDLVKERTGLALAGPIRLLTLTRCFGYYFNPLGLFYCFDIAGQRVEAVVAEVTNTPWLERHWYVLWAGNRFAGPHPLCFRHPKDFHVSPFMDMDAEYEWDLTEPGSAAGVNIVYWRRGERVFDVSLSLQRQELSRGTLVRTLVRHPWMTLRATQAIYWQALRLWWKRCPYYPHPGSVNREESHRT